MAKDSMTSEQFNQFRAQVGADPAKAIAELVKAAKLSAADAQVLVDELVRAKDAESYLVATATKRAACLPANIGGRLALSGAESAGLHAGMSEYARVCLAIDTFTGFTSLWSPNMN